MTVDPDKREVRQDARDVRSDARDVRQDAIDTNLSDRGVRADVREDTLSHREEYIENGIRFLKFLVCVLVVLAAGLLLRSWPEKEQADTIENAAHLAEAASLRAEKTSIESRDAAIVTRDELRAVIAQLEAAREAEPDLQNQAIIDALQAIARIEARMCGGPCPEPGG